MIVAIIGPKRAGKNTLADMIREESGIDFLEYELASVLKRIRPQGRDESKESWRKELQDLGAWRRGRIGEDHLVQAFKVWADLRPGEPIIIPDVRLRIEADMLARMGAWVVHLTAPMEIRRERSDDPGSFDGTAMDVTEREAAEYTGSNFRYVNDGNLDDLRWFAREVASELE